MISEAATVRAWVEAMLGADEAAREEAGFALSRRVKAHDNGDAELDEEALAAVRESLPRLAIRLLDTLPTTSGCTISVLRRVGPDEATVRRLLELVDEATPDARPLVVQALGLCEQEAWSDAVERELVRRLDDPASASDAVYALYARHYLVRRADTVRALEAVAGEVARKERSQALHAVCGLTRGPLRDEALAALERLRAAAPERGAEFDKARAVYGRE